MGFDPNRLKYDEFFDYDVEKDKKYPLKPNGYRDYPDDFWVNSIAPRSWVGNPVGTKKNKEKYKKQWKHVPGPKWVRYMDGRFTAEYVDPVINFHGHILDENTYDSKLWELGILRVVPFNFDKYKHVYHKAYRMDPRYRLAGDGSPNAIESFEVHEFGREEIMHSKKDNLDFCKDMIWAEGFEFGNRHYDLKFRNIAYISLLGLRASHNDIPEDFEWYDSSGRTVTMNEETMVKFCKHVTDYVRKVESNAIQYLNHLDTIEDLVQLANIRLEPDDLLQ